MVFYVTLATKPCEGAKKSVPNDVDLLATGPGSCTHDLRQDIY